MLRRTPSSPRLPSAPRRCARYRDLGHAHVQHPASRPGFTEVVLRSDSARIVRLNASAGTQPSDVGGGPAAALPAGRLRAAVQGACRRWTRQRGLERFQVSYPASSTCRGSRTSSTAIFLGGAILVALSVALGGGVTFALPRSLATAPARERRAATRCCRPGRSVPLPLAARPARARWPSKVLLLSGYVGPEAFARFLGTLPCRAGLSRAAARARSRRRAAWYARRRPDAARPWAAAGVLAAATAVSGAWLVHAAGPPRATRAALMALTVLHQVGAVGVGRRARDLGSLWRARPARLDRRRASGPC